MTETAKLEWRPAIEAPREAFALAVAIRFTCPCAAGGVAVATASRHQGEWYFTEQQEHSFDITHFMELPKPPTGGAAYHHEEGSC